MSTLERPAHCLKAEKSLAMPRHVLFFDTETKSIEQEDGSKKQELILGWVCYIRRGYGRHLDKEEWSYFTTALGFWTFVYLHLQPKIKLWVIARNIAFDFTVVEGWRYLRLTNFKLKFFHNTGLTTVIAVSSKHGSIVFLDSLNWFVESIEKTGLRIGLPKKQIDFDTCSITELSSYCKRDVVIDVANFKQFIKFLKDNAISRLCYTRGSTAMAAYLFSHYHRKIYIHNNKEAIDLEREAYKGGRTECFYLGELNNEYHYILDVNSLYPAVMLAFDYPIRYKRMLHIPNLADIETLLKTCSIIARVLIETDEPIYAVKRERTIFPIGKFWTTLTTPEIKYALQKGHILTIKEAVVYEQANIFKSYVKRFYKLRQRFKKVGNSEYEEFCKKLLNSLYGKFGQKADIWEKIGDCPNEPDRVEDCFTIGDNQRGSIRYLLGEVFRLVGYNECFNSFPAIPAHVAAYGRLYMYDIMKLAGKGNYFYCDTDSLIVNSAGLNNLESQIHDTKLGKLKLVTTAKRIEIRGLKDYSIEEKVVIKGIRKGSIAISEGVYMQENWPSFKGIFRTGDVNSYAITTHKKVLSRKYTKGSVSKSGSISPFVYADSEIEEPSLL